MEILEGLTSSEGISIGKSHIVNKGELVVGEENIPPEAVDDEIERFKDAVEKAEEQLKKIRASLAKTAGEEGAAEIMDAQLLLLQDISIVDEVISLLKTEKKNPEYLLKKKIDEGIASLEDSDDDFLKERKDHLVDIKRRLLANLLESKEQVIEAPGEDRILIIDHLSPSETAKVYQEDFTGIVSEMGGVTSHISIMARTMEIPAVIGIEEATKKIEPGSDIIIDGKAGLVIVNPDHQTREKYKSRKKEFEEWRHELEQKKELATLTKDNHSVTLSANIELPEELEIVKKYNAEGVGLFRTEMLCTTRHDFPSEEEQYRTYLQASEAVNPHSIIIRTFDIGGDKIAHTKDNSSHYEPNPFLGWRAIRIGLSYPQLLKTQIKAILRASARNNNIKIMFPLLSNLNEMKDLVKIFDECKRELKEQNISFDENMEMGAMIEVPSAAITARDFAKYVDFFSIGSNDLVQYTLAADRGNARVADLYQSYNPAVLNLIKSTIDGGHLEGIWVGLCGQIAGDPKATAMLLGMGLDEFSTNPVLVPEIKTIIRSLTLSECKKISKKVLKFHTEEEVKEFLRRENKKILPEKLFDKIYS